MNAVAEPCAIEPKVLERLNCSLTDIAKLCRENQIIELSIFGSVLGDDFNSRTSDIDFLYVIAPESNMDLCGLFNLRKKFSSLMHRRVDLVCKEGLRPNWYKEIMPSAKLIYAE